mmetsp:Transcript_30739/g.80127  ORF Transcript_30739/g.80127 Transcript_30739/m.80127 type:complete len:1164 (+) Transcript_30739:124-3615(+)
MAVELAAEWSTSGPGFKTATTPPMRADSDEPSGVPMRAETDVPSGEATTRAVGGSQCAMQPGVAGGAAATMGGRVATTYADDDHEAALHTAEVSASRAKDLSLSVQGRDDGAPLGCATATGSTELTTVAMATTRQRSAGNYDDEATLDSVLYPPSGPSIHLVPSAVTPPHLEAHLGIQVPVAAAHGSARAARTVVPPTATATLDGSLHTVSRQHGDHATDDAAPSADRLEPIVEHADAGGAIAASCGANADAMYGRAHVCSMNGRDALQHDLPEDDPIGLLRLPPQLLHDIAIWAPLRTFGQVTRLDVRRVACVRLQRWYRSIDRRNATMQLSVGDRVLVVMPRAARQRMEYATAAAEVDDGRSWKVCMLNDVYLTIPTSQIRRLAEWVNGPSASSVGRSAALASASRARSAAMHAAAMVTQAMRAGVPSSQTALVIAAASTASMAAAAATAASSVAAPSAANAAANARQAHKLLAATQEVQKAIVEVGVSGAANHAGGGRTPATAALCDRDAVALVAQAASAAAEAAREASAATSAALAVDSIDSLPATASAVSWAASAAQQVVSAVEALKGAPDACGSATASAVEVAADALADVRAAGRALTNSFSCDASGSGGEPTSTANVLDTALDAAQAAAQVLRVAVEPSDFAKMAGPAMAAAHAALENAESSFEAEARATASNPSYSIDELIRDGASTVLWCWLPRSSAWTESEIVERTTRAVAACRAHDLIALPDLPIVHELVEHWAATALGPDRLDASCVLWFATDIAATDIAATFNLDDVSLDLRGLGLLDGLDPAYATLLVVLHKYRTCGRKVDTLYTMYPDERTCSVAQAFDLRCLGDLDAHPIIGSLRQAKSFLHPSLAHPRRPALRDAALSYDVRGPRGFCCETPEQLLEAWERLKAIDAAMPLVLKPAAGSGGDGVRLNATVADLHSVVAQMRSDTRRTTQHGRFRVTSMGPEEETILEEMVGEPGQPSPTVYMVGTHVAVVADQLLTPCGTANLGNLSPATHVAPNVVEAMVRACVALGTHLGLRGQWGVDFVFDGMATPVMVDLNMGRPNGSLSYYCWRARQPDSGAGANGGRPRRALALVASTFTLPAGLPLGPFATALQAEGLLWDTKRGNGIILAQHLPGFDSGGSVLAASWEGVHAAQHMLEAFQAHLVRLA